MKETMGMMEMMKKQIDMLKNERGELFLTKDFKATFHHFIVDHYLRKFHCIYMHLMYLTTFFA